MNGGSQGGNGELLNTVEYAGYLSFTSGAENVHIPMAHPAAQGGQRTAEHEFARFGRKPHPLTLLNTSGAVGGLVDAFSLTGTGTQFPASVLPAPGSDYAVINLRAVGVRLICLTANCSTAPSSAPNSRSIHSAKGRIPDVPAEFDVFIDVNNEVHSIWTFSTATSAS